MKHYFLTVRPDQVDKFRTALKAEFSHVDTDTRRRIERVLAELQGINETDRGFSRQMVLSKAELRLAGRLSSEHGLGIEITDL